MLDIFSKKKLVKINGGIVFQRKYILNFTVYQPTNQLISFFNDIVTLRGGIFDSSHVEYCGILTNQFFDSSHASFQNCIMHACIHMLAREEIEVWEYTIISLRGEEKSS